MEIQEYLEQQVQDLWKGEFKYSLSETTANELHKGISNIIYKRKIKT